MNERTEVLFSFGDFQNVIDDHKPLLMQALDWRSDIASIASRRKVIEPYARDLARQFAATLTVFCEIACDGGEDARSADRLYDAITDWMDDEFGSTWSDIAERAEYDSSRHGRADAAADRAYDDARAA